MALASDPRVLGLAGLLSALALGCTGPNPLIPADAGSGESTGGDGDGDGDTDGDGDGDDDTTGDGDGDTEADTCQNMVLDGDETDVDCGGSCLPCADGQACLGAEDCTSSVCEGELCLAPACDDDVHNGDEIDVDCGGPCTFCQHSPFLTELDKLEGSDASHPAAAMFPDLSFVVTYNGPMSAEVRWFDALGEPSSPGDDVDELITVSTGEPINVVVGDERLFDIHALVPGQDPMSGSVDLFDVRRDPVDGLLRHRVNSNNSIVDEGDLVIDGTRLTFAWTQSNDVRLRRYDYEIDNWIDIQAKTGEPMTDAFSGINPAMSRNAAGVTAVAWVRCAEMFGPPCAIVVRRFDSDWVDPQPLVVTTTDDYVIYPRVAIAEDGRIAVVWARPDVNTNAEFLARMVDADFVTDGAPWVLQSGLPVAEHADVVALSDGSFAMAWPDSPQDRVHLRRYIGPDMAKVPDLGDEAPWPNTDAPGTVRLATAGNHLVTVWSATVDMVDQIQGQVLSF